MYHNNLHFFRIYADDDGVRINMKLQIAPTLDLYNKRNYCINIQVYLFVRVHVQRLNRYA